MQRELTFHVPFERLMKLSRSASRKIYPSVRWLTWLLIALLIPAVAFLVAFGDELRDIAEDEGIPFGLELSFIIVGLIFFVGLRLVRRYHLRLMKSRANLSQVVRLKQDDGGLHLVTDDIEFYLKWQGLSQMLLERDGVVLSQGNLFFLIPDQAFTNAAERLAFIRDVYGRMSETARAASERHVRAALREGGQRASP
jgi:hypothetical protein